MTSNPSGPHDDAHNAFDWDRLESEVGDTVADVLYLPGARPAEKSGPAVKPVPATDRTDTHYEVQLDDVASPSGAVVDLPSGVGVVAGAGGRRPVIPPSLQGWATIKATAAHVAGRFAYVTAFHTVRSPWYGAQVVWWSGVGIFRLAASQVRWWWVCEQYSMRQAAADANDAVMWLKLHREVKATRMWRAIVLSAEVIGTVLALPVGWELAPWWVRCLGLVGGAWLLTRLGKPSGRTIVKPVTVTGRFRQLNTDIVLRAYYAAGLGHPDRAHQQVTFGTTMSRDASGSGSYVAVDLPHGKTFDDAVKARGALASGLDVSMSQVFISRDPSSHRRHVLYVSDRDPLALPAGRTPLLRCVPTDIWQPAPFGLDERGNTVEIGLMWCSLLIGAQPRQGKTFAARTLALYGALDPFVKLSVFDGGGKPDWRKFALVADRYAFGLALTRDGDPAEIFLDALRDLKADVQDRYERLSMLPVDICPEGKLTRQIARDPSYRMPVRMVVLDEFQEYFDLGDISKEIASLLVYLVKVAPAAGVILVDATQRPSGVGTGQVATQFISYRDNHQVRFSLRTGSWQVSDLVLGSGAYSEGYDSSTLLPTYKGVGILRGATDATPTVRTYLADGDDAEKILHAARTLRERAGTLSGMAAGEDITRQVRDVLADARTVFRAGENGLHWAQIAARLAESIPEHYADVTGDAVSAQLRALRIRSVDVKVAGVNNKGAKVADIDTAINRRATG